MITIPDDLTDSEAVRAWQEASEAELMRVGDLAVDMFLSQAYSTAMHDGMGLGPASFDAEWRRAVLQMLTTSRLSRDTVAYVTEPLVASDIPLEAYLRVREELNSATQAWTTTSLDAMLRDVLGMPVTHRTLTAAAKTGRSAWVGRMRMKVRSAITGFDGALMVAALRASGIPYKVWHSRRDDRVREEHLHADGQKVPVRSPFLVGGQPLQWPGERTAPVLELTINCRCWVVGALK